MKNKKQEVPHKAKYHVTRNHKDRLFRFLFSDKERLLELYNAMNQTSYTNVNDMTVNTIGDAVYLKMKNDISFLMAGTLNIYEHQSTTSENMPLRELLYIAAIYDGFVEEQGFDVYAKKKILLPAPNCIVFYNGTKEQPDTCIRKLSDAFECDTQSKLELEVTYININIGHNQKLLEDCLSLKEYSQYIHKIRCYLEKEYPLPQAIDLATGDCIEENILQKILLKHRGEVKRMLLTEYNEKLHNKTLREEGREEGIHLAKTVIRLEKDGKTKEEISKICKISIEKVEKILDIML